MKALVYMVLIGLLFNNAVEARLKGRALKQTIASASATSVNGGSASSIASAESGGTASAESVADGCNADATTVATAAEGADVDATTVAASEDCADVSATTIAEGEGEDADIDQTTIVQSDEDIDITVYRQRIQQGEDVHGVAVVIVDDFAAYTYPQVVSALIALASDEATYLLFNECVVLLFEQHGCDEFKLIVAGYLGELIVYEIPVEVSQCIYSPCSLYQSSSACCGSAQLQDDQCYCVDGSCLWVQPVEQNGYIPYWLCNGCGEDVELCACY